MPGEHLVGKVTHYYDKLGVAILDLFDSLSVGQTVRFKGAHDDFSQTVNGMQFDHAEISEAHSGEEVGIKVEQKVHENDEVFVVE